MKSDASGKYFRPTTISGLYNSDSELICVKFVGRIMGFLNGQPHLLNVDDRGHKVVVDTSSLESVSCENGEWYRFLGELTSSYANTVLLRVAPVLVNDYDGDRYEKCLHLRGEYIKELDSLVSYAIKHR